MQGDDARLENSASSKSFVNYTDYSNIKFRGRYSTPINLFSVLEK